MTGVFSKYRGSLSKGSRFFHVGYWLPMALLCLFLLTLPTETVYAQKKEKVTKQQRKAKKKRRKNEKKAAQFQGKIDPSNPSTPKGNPTKQKRKKTVKYQDRIGAGKVPSGTKGTKHPGRTKQKQVGKAKGTRYGGQKVEPQGQIKGNPTKQKGTSGKNYQDRIGANKAPSRTEGTRYSGSGSRPKGIGASKGTNYRGDKVPVDSRPKGNPTKNTGNNAKKYMERVGNQGPAQGTRGTNFSGRGRPKKIPTGTQGTDYRGQSTAGSSSTAGGRSTIYGERGWNNKGGRAPQIEQRDQGTNWSGNQRRAKNIGGTPGTSWSGDQRRGKSIGGTPGTAWKGDQRRSKNIGGTPGTFWKGDQKSGKKIDGTPGTNWKGDQRLRSKVIRDYGGDWAGDDKLKKAKKDTRASTYAIKGYKRKLIDQGPGTTFAGHLKKSKKITSWDGSDFSGHLKVNPNKKTRTEGTKFAGHLKVKPNAKVKTEGTKFAGHLKVKPNAKIKTEGMNYRGSTKVKTRFFQKQYYRKKSRDEQLFAGNYKIRRTKGKDLHPSANYTGRQVRRSPAGKEINRKWKLLWAKTNKNADQPKHLKEKRKKPKYDPKEREIWND